MVGLNGWSFDASHGIPRVSDMVSMSVILYEKAASCSEWGELGPSVGMGNPHGSWVWVPSGYGYGSRKVNPHHNPYPHQWVLTHDGYGCG